MDALAVDADLFDFHFFAFQAEGHFQGRRHLGHLFAAAAQGFGGAGFAPGHQNLFIWTHHLFDFGDWLSFPDYHNFLPLPKTQKLPGDPLPPGRATLAIESYRNYNPRPRPGAMKKQGSVASCQLPGKKS
jgi:hypothetical protein